MDDGCDFLLSQHAESVENQIHVEDSLQSMTLDVPELKIDPFMDFDFGDIFSMMETDLSAPYFSRPEIEMETKNERFEPVSDDEIQRLIDSQKILTLVKIQNGQLKRSTSGVMHVTMSHF